MKKIILILTLLSFSQVIFSQNGVLLENKVIKFSIEQKSDTIDFIIVDTLLDQRKPIFLWCQGSLPVPLFCEIENFGYYFFGGGISNFNYSEITKNYHLVVISMPKTPLLAKKENLNNSYQYIPNPNVLDNFSNDYVESDYLENYVNRASYVLKFLKGKSWIDNSKLVVAGHSQGTKVATKIAIDDKDVTHLGLFAANPFGRIDQYIREARLNAQMGKISWEKADSLMNENYEFFKMVNNKDSIIANPSLKSWQSFSKNYCDDWLSLNIPIYLAYGTEDRTSDLCDIVPLFFIEKGKDNLTIKRYLGLEHNFFELDVKGKANYENGHWNEVILEFIKWIN